MLVNRRPHIPMPRKIILDANTTVSITTHKSKRKIRPAKTIPNLAHVYYYPNRPMLMPPAKDTLDKLEASGEYIAELKWNGDNTLIYTSTHTWWNRTKEHLQYAPTTPVLTELNNLFPDPGSIINAETVNRCTKNHKNLIIVHCLMAYKNHLLTGQTWGDSRKILETLNFKPNQHVILSKIYTKGFWDLFQSTLDMDEAIDGIILKRLSGKLVFSAKPLKDQPWMLKFRKPSKKYHF